ncbi:sigma-70 family RNA polymerase sigma factor [Sediminibacillus dalangtanensis]|uniref:Sigma-70 family RNA polymerase sigma factor n=1 Tax=Sediminibacillus dalangtanensis TaxID=2729421 RepID=A0ABX7VWA7_9BACI|nr:sigma-70 family RNA polymerase sigma factor [Sediminibacillus dalangtanensis]QTN00315.1 sigma-70 family RNA polymerase sigma factor [Sediminibacillus dalangtanensis]
MNKKEVLEEWIDKYTQRLVRVAYSYVKDWLKAEDNVQDALIKAYHSMDQLENKGDPFPWLARIVINECKSSFRKSWREIISDFLPEKKQESSEESYLRSVQEEEVHNAVLNLPKHYSMTITLFYFEELSIKQISNILNLSIGTVKSRLARGRELLSRQIEEDKYEGKRIKVSKNVL